MISQYNKFKNKSEIIDMREYLQKVIKTNPEIVEKVIKDRNIIIKSLESDIKHRQIVFKEIEQRYEIVSNKYIESSKQLELTLKENELLKNELKKKNELLEDFKIAMSLNKKEKEGTLSYKLEKISDKIPGWSGKIIFKILASPMITKSIILAIFCILFIASITGWGFIATALKPIISLFN